MKPLFLLLPVLGLLSCAAPDGSANGKPKQPKNPSSGSFFSFLKKQPPPRATVVAPAQTKPAATTAAADNSANLPNLKSADETDGLRYPDMLTMPQKNEFQSTGQKSAQPAGGNNAVISRPPTDPPSRPKTKETENGQ